MNIFTNTLIVIVALLGFSGCTSTPKTPPPPAGEPAWVRQPARTVDGGYIIYVASSEDRVLDKAEMKAQAAAIQDVANECSFAPKGTRLEDRYDNSLGILHRVYAKVAISYQDCQDAQNALDPEVIKRLANVALTEQVKRYQDAVDNEAYEVAENDNEGMNPELANTTGAPGPIHDQVHFFVVRQQIAYAKEVVILASSETYSSGSPQAMQFTQVVAPVATQVRTYQTANPAVASTTQSWSSLPARPAVPALAGVHGMRRSPPHVSGLSPMLTNHVRGAPPGYQKSATPGGGKRGRHKKKKWPDEQ